MSTESNDKSNGKSNDSQNASRGLIKSMLVIASAQSVNVLLSIVRVKVLALLLGPAGVGLLGLYNSLRDTSAEAAGLGLTSSGVREIAKAKQDEQALSRVRRVFFLALFLQGAIAMIVVWTLRERLAVWLIDDPAYATQVGLIGVAVFVFLLAGSQTALLQGMRRIGDLARVTVSSALAGTIAGITAVWYLGENGLIWFILAPPAASLIVAYRYTRRLPAPSSEPMSLHDIWRTWTPMTKLGFVFMLGGLLNTTVLLLVRAFITTELGLDAAGQFAAAWSVSTVYAGFLLNAMGTDYFPRLTEVIADRKAARALMNDQAQLVLAFGGPIMLLLIGWAPWVMQLLYSADFETAGQILQWQSAGNVLKLAGWSLGFAHVAAARSLLFMFNQILWNGLFILMIWAFTPAFGLESTGIAFLGAYLIGLLVNIVVVRHVYEFRWQPLSLWLIVGHSGLALGLLALSIVAPFATALTATALAALAGLAGGHVVLTKIGTDGKFAGSVARFYKRIGWPVQP